MLLLVVTTEIKTTNRQYEIGAGIRFGRPMERTSQEKHNGRR